MSYCFAYFFLMVYLTHNTSHINYCTVNLEALLLYLKHTAEFLVYTDSNDAFNILIPICEICCYCHVTKNFDQNKQHSSRIPVETFVRARHIQTYLIYIKLKVSNTTAVFSHAKQYVTSRWRHWHHNKILYCDVPEHLKFICH